MYTVYFTFSFLMLNQNDIKKKDGIRTGSNQIILCYNADETVNVGTILGVYDYF